MIIIACIIAFKTIFHDFKPEYLISWNAFSNWWIDTYAGLFKMILSIILGITLIWGIGWLLWKWFRAFFIFIFRHNKYSHELWRRIQLLNLKRKVWYMNCVIHQDNINHILLYNVLRDKKSWCVFLFSPRLKKWQNALSIPPIPN